MNHHAEGYRRQVLLIGYGSSFDDSSGPSRYTINLLRHVVWEVDMHIEIRRQLSLDLAERMCLMDLVIFLTTQQYTPGNTDHPTWHVQCQPIAPDPSQLSTLVPELCPCALLAYAQASLGIYPETYTLTLTLPPTSNGESLATSVRHSLPQIISLARTLIDGTTWAIPDAMKSSCNLHR
jgi:hypothetical protein